MKPRELVGVSFIAFATVACGSSSSASKESVLDITNGPTVTSFATHWTSGGCIGSKIKVGFAQNGKGIFHGLLSGGSYGDRGFTWKFVGNDTVLLEYDAQLGALGSIKDIRGGTADAEMTGVGVRQDGFSPNRCTFSLMSGDGGLRDPLGS